MSGVRGLTIRIDKQTRSLLTAAGFHLQIFKTVVASPSHVEPALWSETGELRESIDINWTPHYRAFAMAPEQQRTGGPLTMPLEADIGIGQTARIFSYTHGEILAEGPHDAITLFNAGTASIVCGIEQLQSIDDVPTPICSVALNEHDTAIIRPTDRVLLRFAASPRNGSALARSYSPALAIHCVDSRPRSVSYDALTGWKWDAQGWAGQVRDADLTSALVILTSTLPS